MILRSYGFLASIRLSILFGMLALIGLWAVMSVRDGFIQSHSFLVFEGPANEGRGLIDADELSWYVLLGPLKQQRVNALLVQRVKLSNIKPDELQDGMVHLARLGWRHSASAVNLMGFYSYKRDVPQSLNRIVSLLQRNQSAVEAMRLLTIAQRDATFRKVLIGRLARSPAWRKDYLGFTDGGMSASDLAIRHSIIMDVLRKDAGVTRDEIVPAVWAFFTKGKAGEANSIWNLWFARSSRQRSSLSIYPNEPSFSRLDGNIRSPFEWKLESGDGYSMNAVKDRERAYFVIDWNGSGQPAFAQVNLRPLGTDFRMRLNFEADSGQVKSSESSGDPLAIYLVCRDQGEYRLDAQAVGNRRLEFYLPNDRVSACNFPVLQLRPSVRALGVQQYWEISSIQAI